MLNKPIYQLFVYSQFFPISMEGHIDVDAGVVSNVCPFL